MKSVQSALANVEGVENLKVKIGEVSYSGSAKASDVIAAIEGGTSFKASAQ